MMTAFSPSTWRDNTCASEGKVGRGRLEGEGGGEGGRGKVGGKVGGGR